MQKRETSAVAQDRWPALPFEAWKDTYATLHMWTQVVGKVALARAIPLNHCWAVAFHLTGRGLTTGVLHDGARSFTIEFDLVDHLLVIQVSDGERRALPLGPRPVAAFYREVMDTLADMNLGVRIWPMPVEIPSPVRFEQDTVHRSYDPEFANRFFRIVVEAHRVVTARRSSFIGKCSPVHFFWGGFDLAVTRFSGKTAPGRDGPEFQREAYSHEVISHGFWPGSAPVLEPAFYAYGVPEPERLKSAHVQPEGAYYHSELKEFILPYEVVRRAASPDAALTAFVDSTYEAAATLGGWDRAALERPMLRTSA